MAKILIFRIAFVYISFITYNAFTWWRLGETLHGDGGNGNTIHSFKEDDTKVAGGVLSVLFVIALLLLLGLKVR